MTPMRYPALILLLFGFAVIAACKKNSDAVPPPDPCLNVTVTVQSTKFDAITGQTNGSITVTSPIGAGIMYGINGGAYQVSTNFNNLGAGTYTVSAKTIDGCTGNMQVIVNGYGPKYHAVKQLVLGYCGPCHLNGSTSGGMNFDTDTNIVNAWNRIQARAVNGVPSFMPQGGELTPVDKQKITDWINGGHTTSN